MGDMGNSPVEIIPGTPEDVSGLRAALINMLAGGTSTGATRYTGQINAPTNPMQTQAASMMSNLMGKGNYVPSSGNTHYKGSWGGTTLTPGPVPMPTCSVGQTETFPEGCTSGGSDTPPSDCLAGVGVGVPSCSPGLSNTEPDPGCFVGGGINGGGEVCGAGATATPDRGRCADGAADVAPPMSSLSNGYRPKMAGASGPAFGADGKPMYQNPNLMLKMINSMPRKPMMNMTNSMPRKPQSFRGSAQ